MPSPVLARRLITPFRSKLLAEYAVNGFFGGITTSRATVSPMYPDASGDLVQYAANSVALVNGDSVACWPGFTNLITRSEEFDNATWIKTGVTVDANADQSPDGNTTADKLTISGGNFIRQEITVSAETEYTFSFWAKRGTSTDVKYSAYDGSNFAEIVSPTNYYSQISSSGYTRISFSFTTPVGCTTLFVYPVRNSNDGTVFVWGAQLTESSYLLPYVPTAGSSVAVVRSAPFVSWPSGLDNDYVIKMSVTPRSATQPGFARVFDASNSNTSGFSFQWNSGTLYAYKHPGGNYANEAWSLSVGVSAELIARLSSVNGIDLWVDGTKGTNNSNTDDAASDQGTAKLGGTGAFGGLEFFSSIRDIRIYKVAPDITDAEVLAL